jgi:hypothetical protein
MTGRQEDRVNEHESFSFIVDLSECWEATASSNVRFSLDLFCGLLFRWNTKGCHD